MKLNFRYLQIKRIAAPFITLGYVIIMRKNECREPVCCHITNAIIVNVLIDGRSKDWTCPTEPPLYIKASSLLFSFTVGYGRDFIHIGTESPLPIFNH